MNVYMSVDMEGISGIVHVDQRGPEGREYDRGRHLMTNDANAAIEGLVQAGATYIVVNDSHGPMRNLFYEHMHPKAHLLTGPADSKPHCQVEAADSRQFEAAVFIGYHAMAKAERAVAPHTIVGNTVAELRINDKPHGETGLNAAVVGSLGIPVVMVSGDQTLAAEARDVLGDSIEAVVVKEALGPSAAICRPLAETLPELQAAAKRALENRSKVQPYRPASPMKLEVDTFNVPQCDRASRIANIERVGVQTFRVHGDNPWEQYRALWAALRHAASDPATWLR